MKVSIDTPHARTQSATEKLPATTAVTNTQRYTTHPRQDLSSERRPSARERERGSERDTSSGGPERAPVTRIHRSACCWIHPTTRPNSADFGLISLTTPSLFTHYYFFYYFPHITASPSSMCHFHIPKIFTCSLICLKQMFTETSRAASRKEEF